MRAIRTLLLAGAAAALWPATAAAQGRRGGGGFWSGEEGPGSLVRGEGGMLIDEDTVKTARETASHSTGTPEWKNPRGFEKDVFTFARVIFKSEARPGQPDFRSWGRGSRLGWWVDYPDADLNLSYRLQQLTSLKVDPDCRVLKLSDPAIADYPVIYTEHVGYMNLRDGEVTALRNYLQTGGVLWVNDFWGEDEWAGFESQMKRVLPGRGWTELAADHPIFHCVFDLKGPIKAMQVPTIQFWNPDYDPKLPGSQLQTIYRGEGFETMHLRAWLDDKQRVMVLAIFNSDVSDGWEREGENNTYFHTFSEKISYPLGINIVFYLMTH